MKPLGISLSITPEGVPTWSCPKPSKTEDAIWDAVQTAIGEGWSPKRFRGEAADAWEQILKDDAADAVKDLTKN